MLTKIVGHSGTALCAVETYCNLSICIFIFLLHVAVYWTVESLISVLYNIMGQFLY